MELKKIKRYFNLNMNSSISKFEDSGIGPILSPFINKEKINNLCAEFNNSSKNYKNGLPLRVRLCVFFDSTFFFIIKGVNFSLLLKLVLNIDSFNLKNYLNINIIDFFLLYLLKYNIMIKYESLIKNNLFLLNYINSLNSNILLTIKND